jgi:peptidoglycan/LPS O-acetylase OafA/YrhL
LGIATTDTVLVHVEPPVIEKANGARFYRPELDVLRLVAFMSVFTVHALSLSPGTMPQQPIVAAVGAYGLCLFFLLSSYLITELLCREESKTGTVHIKAFYLRRVLRIWPLYFGFLLFAKIFGHFYPFFGLGTARLLSFLFLAGNWYIAKFGSSWTPAEILWSISVEEQFYLVWPLVAKFGGKRAVGIFSAILLPAAWISLYWHHGYQPAPMGLEFDGTIWCNSLVQFQFFALGALVSILMKGRVPSWNALVRCAVFFSGFGLWFAASWLFRVGHYRDRLPGSILLAGYTLIAAGCVLLLLSLLGARPDRFPQFLIYLGKISYGLYVFHWLSLEVIYVLPNVLAGRFPATFNSIPLFALKYAIALAATVLIASGSYRFFEGPFLEIKKQFTFVSARAI